MGHDTRDLYQSWAILLGEDADDFMQVIWPQAVGLAVGKDAGSEVGRVSEGKGGAWLGSCCVFIFALLVGFRGRRKKEWIATREMHRSGHHREKTCCEDTSHLGCTTYSRNTPASL